MVDRIAAEDPQAVVAVLFSEAPDDVEEARAGDGGVGPATDLPHRDLLHRDLPHRDLVRHVVEALDDYGLPLRDALLVRGGRWWSYDCPHACCEPGAGTPMPRGVTEVEVAAVATGTVVAPDRAALAARLARPEGAAAAAMAAACSDAVSAVARQVADEGAGSVALDTWTAILAGLAACAPGATPAERLSDADVARIVCGLRDVLVRDLALSLALGADAAAAEVLWTECARRAPAPLDAAPATLLAVSAWLRGDGAMANIALDRALDGQPDYALARLLADALAKGVPPRDIRALVAEAAAALTGQWAAGPAGGRAGEPPPPMNRRPRRRPDARGRKGHRRRKGDRRSR